MQDKLVVIDGGNITGVKSLSRPPTQLDLDIWARSESRPERTRKVVYAFLSCFFFCKYHILKIP